MAASSRYCANCGSQAAETAAHCDRCGAQLPCSPEPGANPSASQDRTTLGSYQRFLFPDMSGGFTGVTAPVAIWSLAIASLIWVVIGLLALRFDLSGTLELVDVLVSQLLVFGMAMSVAVNGVVVYYMRGKDGRFWMIAPSIPVAAALLLCGGLPILIYQVWYDSTGGLIEKIMFMLIGLGSCLTHIGLLSLADVGPIMMYRVARWVAIGLTAIIAFEIVDALWITTSGITGEGFSRAFWQALIVCASYLLIVGLMSPVKNRRVRNGALVAYFGVGLAGFLIAMSILWDNFDAGIARFTYGAVIAVAIASIGLLLVHHFHKNPPIGAGMAPPT